VYVRLAVAWADPGGAVHSAGEFVDIDVVTLAELEERGVVENPEEISKPEWWGPGRVGEETEDQLTSGEGTDTAEDAEPAEAGTDEEA
jgi:hypothetical protein